MHSGSREEIGEVLDALDATVERACELTFDALITPERLRILVRLEKIARRLPVPRHALINQLAGQATRDELGGKLRDALAYRLHITPGEPARRLAEAADLGPRRALTGEPLPPLLTGTAAARHDGTIGAGHVHVIRRFLDHLPCSIDIGTREKAEAHLADLATEHRPDDLAKLAQQLTGYLNPDGTYTDDDRARRRGLTLGNQDIDGMPKLTGWLTPEARATLEAVAPASGRYPQAIFDKGKALALYHTKRLATPGPTASCSTPKTAAVPAPAATSPATGARSTTSRSGQPPTTPTSTSLPWPAAPTTRSSNPAAGPPANAPTATPNGSPRRISTTGSHEPIRFTIRKSS